MHFITSGCRLVGEVVPNRGCVDRDRREARERVDNLRGPSGQVTSETQVELQK